MTAGALLVTGAGGFIGRALATRNLVVACFSDRASGQVFNLSSTGSRRCRSRRA